MNVDDFRTLYAFNRWANERTIDTCRALDPSRLEAPCGGSFGSIRATLGHITWAEWLWLERWQHRSPRNTSLPELSDLDGIIRVTADVARGQEAFIDELTDDRLAERISYINSKGETWTYSLGHMMQHVVNHSTYHRGQIVILLRQATASAVSTDFLLWFDTGMPA